MKKIVCYSFLLLFCVGEAVAQVNIHVNGKAVNGVGKRIELYRYSDPFTQQEVLLDSMTIGENTEFELAGYANYPTLMYLQVENYSQSFYVVPGRTYNVRIHKFNWDIDEEKNVFLSPEVLPVEFLEMPKDDINALTTRFDMIVDSFINANRYVIDFKFHPQKRYFDTLVNLIETELPDGEDEFFNRYKRYQLATLRFNLGFANRKTLVDEYIKGQPIMYYDENYMMLLTTLFDNYVSMGNKYIGVEQMSRWVDQQNLFMMMDSLGTDPMLRNEQLREFVVLQALKEAHENSRYYHRENVRKMLDKLANTSKFEDHRILARRVLEDCSRMECGSTVEGFYLPDVNKRMVSLDDFEGKWVYLSFIRVGDPNSLSEIETMAHFKDTVYAKSKNVEFVTIVCDREFQKMYHFLKNSRHGDKYNWTWLHFDNDFSMLERYEVVSYPTFILITPEGRLYYSVTPTPGSGFLLSPPWEEKKEAEKKEFFMGTEWN